MFEFLIESANRPFAVSLGLMIGIGLMEGLGQLAGFGFSNLLHSLFPHLDLDADLHVDLDADVDMDVDMDMDADVDMDADLGGHAHFDLEHMGSSNALSGLLGWFHVGRVPILVLLVLFLFSFSAGGYVLQFLLLKLNGSLLPALTASLAALLLALGFVRGTGGLIARLVPKEETEAVSLKSLVGREAMIVLGTAQRGRAAQAKVLDQHGKTHYLMVEPAEDNVVFRAGERVLLVDREGSVFLGVPAP